MDFDMIAAQPTRLRRFSNGASMRALKRSADRLANLLGGVGSIGILLMMVHICADVMLRRFISAPIPGTNEIVSRYYMVLIAFLPLAWVEHNRGMIAVEFFDALLKRRARQIADLVVAVASLAIFAFLAYSGLIEALEEFKTGSYVMSLSVAIPVWISYFFAPVGFAIAALLVLVRAIFLGADLLASQATDTAEPEARP